MSLCMCLHVPCPDARECLCAGSATVSALKRPRRWDGAKTACSFRLCTHGPVLGRALYIYHYYLERRRATTFSDSVSPQTTAFCFLLVMYISKQEQCPPSCASSTLLAVTPPATPSILPVLTCRGAQLQRLAPPSRGQSTGRSGAHRVSPHGRRSPLKRTLVRR